ncbi:MAG: hypothetical protein ACI9OE_000553 [Mariniflexile sp.]|jgi:hypothetical protein
MSLFDVVDPYYPETGCILLGEVLIIGFGKDPIDNNGILSFYNDWFYHKYFSFV